MNPLHKDSGPRDDGNRNRAWMAGRLDNPHRLMEEGVLTDLQIKTHDQTVFNVHKLVLVTHSEYFLRMLTR